MNHKANAIDKHRAAQVALGIFEKKLMASAILGFHGKVSMEVIIEDGQIVRLIPSTSQSVKM